MAYQPAAVLDFIKTIDVTALAAMVLHANTALATDRRDQVGFDAQMSFVKNRERQIVQDFALNAHNLLILQANLAQIEPADEVSR